jgi:hypothetical protein
VSVFDEGGRGSADSTMIPLNLSTISYIWHDSHLSRTYLYTLSIALGISLIAADNHDIPTTLSSPTMPLNTVALSSSSQH